MIYSTSTKYAVMALIELARRSGGPVQIREISESTGIPRFFLAKLVQTPRRPRSPTWRPRCARRFREGREGGQEDNKCNA